MPPDLDLPFAQKDSEIQHMKCTKMFYPHLQDENVVDQLQDLIRSGRYTFYVGSEITANIELYFDVPVKKIGEEDTESSCLVKWKRDELDEFIIKLGFVDAEVKDREKVETFIKQSEVNSFLVFTCVCASQGKMQRYGHANCFL